MTNKERAEVVKELQSNLYDAIFTYREDKEAIPCEYDDLFKQSNMLIEELEKGYELRQKQPPLNNDVELLVAYESVYNYPSSERFTKWFCTYGINVFKSGYSYSVEYGYPNAVQERIDSALESLGLTREEFEKENKYHRIVEITVAMYKHLGKALPSGLEKYRVR